MKTIVKLLTFALLLSTLNSHLSPLFAQGTAFTYQGRLNDGAGPANGAYDLTFMLFGTNSGGSSIAGPLTNSATGVTNGQFTVTLDFGNQFPGLARWLEMSVRTNGSGAFSTLNPRQPLTSTPYAIQSANAANAASANSVAAANISGTLAATQLPTSVVTNGASGVSISGAFTGNGSGLTNVPGTLPWHLVAGTNATAAANQAYLLTNSSASTVTLPTNANAGDIVTVSGDGSSGWQVLTASGQVIVDQNSPPIWTSNNNSPAANWSAVASSAGGTNLVAVVNGGQIYTSSDSGVTWSANTNAPAASWTSVASSADGTKVVAMANSGQIYTSGDSGSHWSLATNVPTASSTSLASSADGTKLWAVGGTFNTGFMYESTNSGATWSSISAGLFASSMVSVASSADGAKLVAAGVYLLLNPNSYNGGAIFTSTNSGLNWIPRSPNAPNTPFWSSVASSSDGTKLVAVYGTQFTVEGQIATSANSGAAWSINANFSSVRSVSSSADGTRLVAVTHGGGIYTSRDSGVTWLGDNAPATNWITVASSADGTRLVAAVSGGQIWTSVAGIGTAFGGTAGTTTQFHYLGNGVWQPAGVAASQVTGTLPASALPANVVTNGETGVTLSGLFSGTASGALSGTISGNGSGLTNLNASQLTSGTLPGAALSGTYGNVLSFTNLANSFSGNGRGLTNLNGTNLLAGSVGSAQLAPGAVASPLNGAGTTLQALANTVYNATNSTQTTFVLPATANVGDVIQINGTGSGGWLANNSTPGVTWTAQSGAPTTNWQSVASSADGTKLVAVGNFGMIYTSTNNGGSWTVSPLDAHWQSVASSADGTRMVAVAPDAGIYASTNSGGTWQAVAAPGLTWLCVASSADGTRLLLGGSSGTLYTSTNSGGSWTAQTNSPPGGWQSVASSADGTSLVAVRNGGQIYTSTNSGTWTARESNRGWFSVASSADGTRMVAAVNGGQIYTSTDGGVTWTGQSGAPSANWSSVASSADGTRLAAVVNGGRIYTSTDGGVTWTGQSGAPSANWSSVASSADGTRLVALVKGGLIYTSSESVGSGIQGSSGQFQYLGNGLWQQITPTGSFSGNGNGLTSLNATNIVGTLSGAALSGADGSGLINLNASQLTSGTVAEARLSTNVALRSSGNTFTGNQIVSSGSLGIGNSSPVAPLSFNSVLGDKISLYNSSSTQFYGFGIQSFQLQIHTDTTNADVVFGSGNSTAMTETMRIKGNGNVGIGTSDPGLNNLQINPLLESANGYGLVVCRTNYGANIQISSVNGQNAIGLVVDDVSNGDSNTSMLLIRNNMGGGGQTLMNVLATGKVAIGPITPTNTLHVGGGVSATAFVTTSDRNAKENFARVSPSEVLEKVAALPISTWNYKTMNDGRHMGPMAQDFYDAFHLGGGDTTITTIDPDGVALAAIQGLNQKLEQKQTEITELKKQVNELRDLVYSINHTQNGGRK